MKRRIATWVAGISLFAKAASGAELFENVHVVQWPKGLHGYRGAMGDFHARDGLHVARIGIGWFYGQR